jgi:glycosyltransferase involved in cell wall biosynthesis
MGTARRRLADGAVPDVVVDGLTGMLVKLGDVDALQSALSLLAADPGGRRPLAQQVGLRLRRRPRTLRSRRGGMISIARSQRYERC